MTVVVNNRILVCIKNEDALRSLREQLAADGGYLAASASDPAEMLSLFKQDQYDLLILGVDAWDEGWQQVFKELRSVDPDCVAVLFSEALNYGLMEKTAGLGIYDYLSNPVQKDRLFFVIRKAIERHTLLVAHRRHVSILKEQNLSLQKQNVLLARRIEESARNLSRLYDDLRSVYMRTIRVLAQAIDARDHYTHSHSMNVAKIAVAISQQIGLTVKEIELIREASELHDLGKIGIEDNILGKPSGLTPEEWQQVRLHP
jgi:putative two-component system response regulator